MPQATPAAAGTPVYPASIDTDATLGPLSSITAGSTTLAAGDQLGIAKNYQNQIIALQTKCGVTSSTDPNSLDYKNRHHAANHNLGGSDAIAPDWSQIQNKPAMGSGDMTKAVYDTNGNNVVDTCDSLPYSKLTGAQPPPIAHASTHLSAGSDPIAIATTVLAGLCPAVDNTTIQIVASKLSCVALAWTAITGKPSTFAPAAHESTHVVGGSDPIPVATTAVAGLCPPPDGTTIQITGGKLTAPSSGGGVPATDIQIFATVGSFTWTPASPNPKLIKMIAIGGGGGAGSGAYVASGTAGGGGGGGAGGNMVEVDMPGALIAAAGVAFNVVVGAGGTGGAGATTAGSGNAGNAGGASSVQLAGNAAYLVIASGGNNGGGGATGGTAGTAGTIGTYGSVAGTAGGAGGASGATGGQANGSVLTSNNLAGTGGGGGAGLATTPANLAGGAGGAPSLMFGGRPSGAGLGGTSATPAGVAGAIAGTATTDYGATARVFGCGGGGGGGASQISGTNFGNGGNGGVYGGGGGGGGAGLTVMTQSGAGGNGGNGVVIIIAYY